jgi:hypothetical protein
MTNCEELSMRYGSTYYLKLLATEGAYILLQRSAARGRLKRDFVSIKVPGGEVEMQHEILNDFLRASLVVQDHAEDSQERAVFRLTEDGYKRAQDALAALPIV